MGEAASPALVGGLPAAPLPTSQVISGMPTAPEPAPVAAATSPVQVPTPAPAPVLDPVVLAGMPTPDPAVLASLPAAPPGMYSLPPAPLTTISTSSSRHNEQHPNLLALRHRECLPPREDEMEHL